MQSQSEVVILPAAPAPSVVASYRRGRRLLTAKQVSAILGVSEATTWRWSREGRLPPKVKIGPQATRWDSDLLDAWLAEKTGVKVAA